MKVTTLDVKSLIEKIDLPKIIPISQCFSDIRIDDIQRDLHEKLNSSDVNKRIKPGMKIAIAVGSRGICNIALIVKEVVKKVKDNKATPFIVPAMGSHGGATEKGQTAILEGLGITEKSMNCRICSSMEVVKLGSLDTDVMAYMDSNAFNADGIIIINRVKSHTGFSGNHESGLLKMITIGLGKQKGAESCHNGGRERMSKNIEEVAKLALAKTNIIFGVGIVENAFEHIMKLEIVLSEDMISQDYELLQESKKNMAKILLQPIDILVIGKIGKEFSGAGMDPHVTGRAAWKNVIVGPEPERIVVLDLSEYSKGNAVGIGMADISTRKVFNKINLEYSYINALTAGGTQSVRIPMILENDKLALQAACRTCKEKDILKLRVVYIPNTLDLTQIYISEALRAEAVLNPFIKILGISKPFVFNESHNLSN